MDRPEEGHRGEWLLLHEPLGFEVGFISTTQLAWVRISSRMTLESSVLGWASHPPSTQQWQGVRLASFCATPLEEHLDLQAIWDGLVVQWFLWARMAKCSKDGMDFDLVQQF